MLKKEFLNQINYAINLKELSSLLQIEYADKTAFSYQRSGKIYSVTYNTFFSDVSKFGSYLFSIGVVGRHIVIIGENSYFWLVSLFSIINSGNVAIPINKDESKENITKLIYDCDADIIIYSNLIEYKIEKDILENIKNYISFNEIGSLMVSQDKSYLEYNMKCDTMASIIYTSGTTGSNKGVMLSHENLLVNAISIIRSIELNESTILLLPLHHSYALVGSILAELIFGANIFILDNLRNMMDSMRFVKPNNLVVVPMFLENFYKEIWREAAKEKKVVKLKIYILLSGFLKLVGLDIRRLLFQGIHDKFGSNLKKIITGGAPIKDKYLLGMEKLGFEVLNGYGITECSPVVSVNREGRKKKGAGLVLPCNEVKIIEGEICIKGKNVMLGYYKDIDCTKKVLSQNWFYSGDLGFIDKDSYLHIVGRKKNLIILSNGENVIPEEIESKLLEIPAILECIVYAEDNFITAEILPDYNIFHVEKHIVAGIEKYNKIVPKHKRIQSIKYKKTPFLRTSTNKIIRPL